MLLSVDAELLSALERIAASRDGKTVLAWLEASRDALRVSAENDDPDHPRERGGAKVLTLLLDEARGAAKKLARSRDEKV